MHVFAVQGKEDELCEAFDVVAKSLSRAEVMSLLTQQASGGFFTMPPVDKYGSNPFSYACVMGMKRAIAQIFQWDLTERLKEEAAHKKIRMLSSLGSGGSDLLLRPTSSDANSTAGVSALAASQPRASTPRVSEMMQSG